MEVGATGGTVAGVGEGGSAGRVGGAEVGMLHAKIASESTKKKTKQRLRYMHGRRELVPGCSSARGNI